MSRLTRVAKAETPEIQATSDRTGNTNNDVESETSKKDATSSYAVKSIVDVRKDPQGQIKLFAGTGVVLSTIRSSPPLTLPVTFWMYTLKVYKATGNDIGLQ